MSSENYIAIIGPPRSGTSWLYHYFKTHPGVFAPRIKEINWFNIACGVANPQQVANVQRLYQKLQTRVQGRDDAANEHLAQRKERFEMQRDCDLRAFYASRVAGDTPFIDVSPGYAALPEHGFQRIADTFANAKVVMLLRNPADRAWSLAHHARAIHAPSADIKDVIAQMADLPPTPLSRNLQDTYACANSVFDADRIHCLFTEDLFDPTRQQHTLDQLSSFMGAAPHPVGGFDFTGNRGQYDAIPDWFADDVTAKNQSDIAWARSLMGRLPERWISNQAASNHG